MIAGISLSLRDQVCYRMHVPRWAWAPTSGLGAARQGGRLNRAGIEALYLALESETAIAEFQQAAALLPPATKAYGQFLGRDFNPLAKLLLLRTSDPNYPQLLSNSLFLPFRTYKCHNLP